MFGGTFDPPHVGHLALAEWACDALGLDRVLFVPARQPPHKPATAPSPVARRLAMIRLAVRGNPRFAVSTLELERTGPSYTVDTLRALARRHPRAGLHLLIGGDSLGDFPRWREAREIARIATLVVAGRPGVSPARRAGARTPVVLDNPPLDIASRVLRQRVREGRSIRYLVPELVRRYIARHRLYAS